MNKYQFVKWFPHWVGFSFIRLDSTKTDMAYVYEWFLCLGYAEIRKWSTRKVAV